MTDEIRKPDAPQSPIEAPEDDWIGDVADKARAFRAEMADVAREADEGMIDGPLGKVLVFVKRYWAVALLAILPFVPLLFETWAENDPFPAVPEIITEAEVREISDYMLAWSTGSGRTINRADHFDMDGDGENDARFYAFACSEPERETWYIRTRAELPTLWQVITGKCGLHFQGEEFAIQDGQVCIIVNVYGETAGDRSELRWVVEQVLAYIREDMADGEVTLPEWTPSPLDEMLSPLLQDSD